MALVTHEEGLVCKTVGGGTQTVETANAAQKSMLTEHVPYI